MKCTNMISKEVFHKFFDSFGSHFSESALESSLQDITEFKIARMPENMMMAMINHPKYIEDLMQNSNNCEISFPGFIAVDEPIVCPLFPIHMIIKPPVRDTENLNIFGWLMRDLRDPMTGINKNFGFHPNVYPYTAVPEFRFISYVTIETGEGSCTLPVVISAVFCGYNEAIGYKFSITKIQ